MDTIRSQTSGLFTTTQTVGQHYQAVNRANTASHSYDDLNTSKSPVIKTLLDADIDTSTFPTPFLDSPELFNALKERKLLVIDLGDDAAKNRVQELVSDLSSKHIQGKPLVPNINLSDIHELGDRLATFAQVLQTKDFEAGKKLSDNLNTILQSDELDNREKQNKIASLLFHIARELDSNNTSDIASVMERLTKHLIHDELSDRLKVKQQNASDKIDGSRIDIQKYTSELQSLTTQLQTENPQLANLLDTQLESITHHHHMSDKEKANKLIEVLNNAITQYSDTNTQTINDQLKLTKKTIADDVSDIHITAARKSALKDVVSEVTTQKKELGEKLSQETNELFDDPFLTNEEKSSKIKTLLAEAVADLKKNNTLSTKNNTLSVLTNKLEKVVSELNKPNNVTTNRVVGYDSFHADQTPTTPNHEGKMAAKLAEKALLGGVSAAIGGEITGSQVTSVSGKVSAPIGHTKVEIHGSVNNQSIQHDNESIQEGSLQQIGGSISAGPLSIGSNFTHANINTFNDVAHLAQHIHLDERAATTAMILEGSQMTTQELATLTVYANDASQIRDEADKLTQDLRTLGVLMESEELKAPVVHNSTLPHQETATMVDGHISGKLGFNDLITMTGKATAVRKETTKVAFGDKVDQLHNNAKAMEANLKEHNLDSTLELRNRAANLNQDPTGNMKERNLLKSELKNQILANLTQQQAYISAIRLGKEQPITSQNGSSLMNGVGRLADSITSLFQEEKKDAKSKIEQSLNTTNETETLDKLLVNHAALTQAYYSLIETGSKQGQQFIPPTSPIDSSSSQNILLDVLHLEQNPKMADEAIEEAQFLTLLHTAKQELASPNTTLSLETMKKIQTVSKEIEKDFISTFQFQASFGVGNVYAEVSHKRPFEQSEVGQERLSETLINLKGNVTFSASIIENMIGKAQEVRQESDSSMTEKNKDFIQLMVPALKAGAELEIKLEGEEIVLGNVTLNTNVSTPMGNVDIKLMTTVTGDQNDEGEVVLSLRANTGFNQDILEHILPELKNQGLLDDEKHEHLEKEYQQHLNDLSFTVGEHSKELEIRMLDGRVTFNWR